MTKRTVIKASVVPGILLIGAVAMQGLGATKKQTNRRNVAPEPRAVETRNLVFGDLALKVEGNGVIESERTLDIVSEASGRVTFAKSDLKDGTFVKAGEVVVRIDSRDVENQLYGQRSDFLNAVASVLPELRIDDAHVYRRWFDYFNSLDIDKPVPDLPQITHPQEKLKVSTKNIIGKYYEVRNQEILLSKHTVRAPFDGFISSSGVIENSFVSTGQALFTLSDPKNLVVTVPLLVEESKSIDFASAPQVMIHADRGSQEVKAGRITRKETMLDRNSQTLDVFVTFSNRNLDPDFLPGSYVHVEIDGKTLHDVAPIPRHLVDPSGHIFTMEEGALDRAPVEVVAYQGDVAIISNSVPEHTVLVTTILQKPLVGMDIRSINMPELNTADELAEAGEGAGSDLADSGPDGESVGAGG
jgi:multidrug efflux pump subunit AcrA (membrane-fusion protein)